MLKKLGILIVLVLLGAGGYFGYKHFFADESEQEIPPQEPVAVETEDKTWKEMALGYAVEAKDFVKEKAVELYEEFTKKEDKAKADKKETPKEKKKSEQAAQRENEMKAEDFIKQGNQSLLSGENIMADESFRNALSFAQSDEMKYKAWRGRAMAAKMMSQGEAELSAGKAMLGLSESDADKANSYEALGNGYENMQSYPEAVNAYQQAAALYQKSGNIDMAWSTLAACGKVMRRGLNDYVGASQSIGRAWEVVDKSQMDAGSKNNAKWMLCLEYADNCRMAGDRYGQINWNREAVKYNPGWKQTADMLEREIKGQTEL